MNPEELLGLRRNMSTKNKEVTTSGEELLEKASILHEAFEKSGEKEPEIEMDELERRFQKLLKEIPDEAIRNRVAKVIDTLRNEKIARGALKDIVEDTISLNMEHYFDLREYVKLARRELSKYRLSQMVDEIADKETIGVDDLQKIVRVAFDLNGLKAMNDLGGHKMGDEGLRLFSTILREGETTKWLESLGYVVVPSAEGGDEFGMIISGLKNNQAISKEMMAEIGEKIHKEVLKTDAKRLVDLEDVGVRKRLLKTGFAKKQVESLRAQNFSFKLSTSVGLSRFDEALENVPVKENDDYRRMVKAIVGKMFDLADEKALANKTEFKSGLEHSANPLDNALFEMYSRLDKESIKLRVQNRDLRELLASKGISESEIDSFLKIKAAEREKEQKEEGE